MTRSPLILATLALTLALAGCGNRSVGNKIDDQFIAPEVSSNVARAHIDLTSPTSRIVVTSYNGVVLLAGQTPRSDLKAMAEQAARKKQRQQGAQRAAGATPHLAAGTQQRLA